MQGVSIPEYWRIVEAATGFRNAQKEIPVDQSAVSKAADQVAQVAREVMGTLTAVWLWEKVDMLV